MQFGLDELTLEKIQKVFDKHKKVEEVLIYGSRAKGSTKYTAKIELAVLGRDLVFDDLLSLENKINRLKLDYQSTICLLKFVSNAELKDHILAFGKAIYAKNVLEKV